MAEERVQRVERYILIVVTMAMLLAVTPRLAMAGDLWISEFMAVNKTTVTDADGEYTDWIEIHNASASPVNLGGYHLTDDIEEPQRWTFPSIELSGGGYLLVFASGKDRTDPAGELHTNFKLSGGGEYLALRNHGGSTAVHEYLPTYPVQSADISYGVADGWMEVYFG